MTITILFQILPWLNRTLWVLTGLLCGVLAAHSLSLVLGSPGGQVPVAEQQSATTHRDRELLSDYSVILERNLFGVAPGTLSDSPPEDLGASAAPAAATGVGDVTLFGTVAGGASPLALLRTGGELLLVHLGEELPGGRTLVEVRRSEVVLRFRDGREGIVPLQEGISTPVASARPSRGAEAGDGQAFEVESLGDNRWRIPREEAERARSNLNALLKTARMTPNIVEGRTEGFQVVTVQPRSLLAQMGIRPRDVLMQINGVELDSPEKALQIFYQLREARTLSLSLMRNGQPLTFDYVVE